MKLPFKHKVFLAFLLNSILIVMGMLLIARFYAFRNFEDYIGKVEMERLGELSGVLSREYQEKRSWPAVLEDLEQPLTLAGILPGNPQGPVRGGALSFPPPLPPPGSPLERNLGRRKPPAGELFPPRPDMTPGSLHRGPRICLFDAEKKPLAPSGLSSAEGFRLTPILVEGQAVGWLGIRRPEGLTHPLDVEFIRNQSQTLYSVGGVALLLALLVTFVLSHHLLSPVKELAAGTRALTSRKFDTRIEARSRDELGQLAADFNKMAQALERHEQMRRQWMADISHELRTPLAVLRAEIEAMQDGVKEVTPEALESLHFEVLHVGRIVEDLNDLSRIESQAFDGEKTSVDPLGVLEETLRSFITRFEQRGIRIVAGANDMRGVSIMADAVRLTQLFSNLLENALRYVDSPGTLKIDHEIETGRLVIYFEDSGPGVPEESLGRLFDRLYRVDRARSRVRGGGSGLGLTICKGIVESSGGQIEATHAPSGGLRIVIAFPVLCG